MTKRYGILAYPAKHSLSPVMFNAAFKETFTDAEYRIFEIPIDKFSEFLEKTIHDPIDGLSVSLPYKEKIFDYLNVVDEDAKKIVAVNTVSNKGGHLYGYNTDYLGSNMALKETYGHLKNTDVVILGAGGASRAIAYGLLKEGANVAIYNRNEEKAKILADDLEKIFGKKIKYGSLDAKSSGDILIQATSIWTLNPKMSDQEIDAFCSIEYIEKFDVVMDIIYRPLKTPLLEIAEGMGKKIITGEKMLLHQAIFQFKIWTEKEAPVEVMKKVLLDQLLSFS